MNAQEDEENCTICLNLLNGDEDDEIVTECQHAFHIACLSRWLEQIRICPNCRAPIERILPHIVPLGLNEDRLELNEDQLERLLDELRALFAQHLVPAVPIQYNRPAPILYDRPPIPYSPPARTSYNPPVWTSNSDNGCTPVQWIILAVALVFFLSPLFFYLTIEEKKPVLKSEKVFEHKTTAEPIKDQRRQEEFPRPMIAIDLGTSYSLVGVYKNGRVNILSNDQGRQITPSVVAFTKDGTSIIGDLAQLEFSAKNTIHDIRLLIGQNYTEAIAKKTAELRSFDVSYNQNLPVIDLHINHKKQSYRFEQIMALLLMKMKEYADGYLGEASKSAVITVSAAFTESQRRAIRAACTIAGLSSVRLINESTAVAIAYGATRKFEGFAQQRAPRTILVFNMGGGMSEASVLEMKKGTDFYVRSSRGNRLGGEDFNRKIFNYVQTMITVRFKGKVFDKTAVYQLLRREIEYAKRMLSSSEEAVIELELPDGHFKHALSREKFAELTEELLQSSLKMVQQALADAKITKDQVDDVILVGGMSRLPILHDFITQFFNMKESAKYISPEGAAVYGATYYAEMLQANGEKGLLYDVNTLEMNNPSDSNREQVLRMAQAAQKMAAQDKKVHAINKAREALELRLYRMRDQITDRNQLVQRLTTESRLIISAEIDRLLNWIDENRESAEIGEKTLKTKKNGIERLLETELSKVVERAEL